MATYIVINKHRPQDCEPMDAGLEHLSERLRGQPFYCSCPYGEHAFYMILEGATSEEVVGDLPSEWQPGTRAMPLEVFQLPG
jgi:hypothetical protein